jgi:hypothetical protein
MIVPKVGGDDGDYGDNSTNINKNSSTQEKDRKR